MSETKQQKTYRKTIAFDFDGVIHKYSKGWHDGTCYDEPMDGVLEVIAELLKDYNVFILSTRSPESIFTWLINLKKHHFPFRIIHQGDLHKGPFWMEPGVVGITNRKLVAAVYVDDRALLYEKVYPWRHFKRVVQARADQGTGTSTASQGAEDPARVAPPTDDCANASSDCHSASLGPDRHA